MPLEANAEYQSGKVNYIVNADATSFMEMMDPDSIDLTVTSPPYDDLRVYKGYKFDYELMARGLYRVTKPGGVVVWVVGDKIQRETRPLPALSMRSIFKKLVSTFMM